MDGLVPVHHTWGFAVGHFRGGWLTCMPTPSLCGPATAVCENSVAVTARLRLYDAPDDPHRCMYIKLMNEPRRVSLASVARASAQRKQWLRRNRSFSAADVRGDISAATGGASLRIPSASGPGLPGRKRVELCVSSFFCSIGRIYGLVSVRSLLQRAPSENLARSRIFSAGPFVSPLHTAGAVTCPFYECRMWQPVFLPCILFSPFRRAVHGYPAHATHSAPSRKKKRKEIKMDRIFVF